MDWTRTSGRDLYFSWAQGTGWVTILAGGGKGAWGEEQGR